MWSYDGQPKSDKLLIDTGEASLYLTSEGEMRIVDDGGHILLSAASLVAFGRRTTEIEHNASVCGEG